MKKYLPAILITFIIVNFGCKTASRDAVEIKFRLPKGDKYEYSINMKMNINEKVMDKNVEIQSNMGFTYVFEVINDSAGWKTLSATISRFSMDMNSMGHTMHLDTEGQGDTTGPMAIASKIFGAMKGSQFWFTLNDKGEVGEMRGMKEMMEKMLVGIPNSEQALKSLKGSVDEESMKQNMQKAFEAYPGKPVRPGDSWSKIVTQQTQGMNIKSDNNFTLESVNGNDAAIKVTSKLSSPENSSINGAQMNVNGTSEGEVHYDLTTGMTTSGNQDMKMTMKVNTQGMEIPMDMDITMTTKGRKI